MNQRCFSGLTMLVKVRKCVLSALITTTLAFFSVSANADTDTLEPTSDHRDATAAIYHLMERYHYKTVSVNDDLSEQIFDRYLDSLDPQKSFLLQSDMDEFEGFRTRFDDAIRNARLKPVFAVFNRFRSRIEERAEYAKSLLNSEFDFLKEESFTYNREDSPWFPSQQAMDEYWRKRVKNDVLSLRLTDMEDDKIIETLESRYDRMAERVTQLKENDVFQFFINAYTTSVEPHTSYFSPRNSEEFKIRMSLSLEGIGAALRTVDEYTVIQRLITGGPASLSDQLSVGDRIVGVGDEGEEIVDVVSWSISDVVDLIRGPKGSTVNLKILPDAAPIGTPPKIVSLVRDKIKLEEQAAKSSIVQASVDGLTKNFGVIDLPTFYLDSQARAQGQKDYRSTTRDVKNLLAEFDSVEGGIEGVIIDLRGNGGGSLVEATELTGIFIEKGPVVQIRNVLGEVSLEQDDDPTVAYAGPLAVLVDRYSASASEIFAAAIQDYGRGVVLGEPTFGKGTVQNVVPLDRAGTLGQLKVTIAQFFRVNGEGTQFRGVVPDIVFPTAIDSDAQGERGLDNALPWAEVPATKYNAWIDQKPDYSGAMARHESRYRDNRSFDLLLDELKSQRESRDERDITLVESIRKQEINEQDDDREERMVLIRKAFGASSGDDDTEADYPDIILEEAASVLGDILVESATN